MKPFFLYSGRRAFSWEGFNISLRKPSMMLTGKDLEAQSTMKSGILPPGSEGFQKLPAYGYPRGDLCGNV